MGLFDKFKKKEEKVNTSSKKEDVIFDLDEIDTSLSKDLYASTIHTSRGITEQEKVLKEAETELKKEQIILEKSERENEKYIRDMQSRIDATNDLTSARHARNIVADEVSKIKYESKKQSFDEKYKLIQALETYTRMNLRPSEKNDLKPNVYDLYRSFPENIKNKVFIPYYLEKKELGIATSDDLNKLKEIANTEEDKMSKNYISGLGVLDMLGIIDVLDNSYFSASYSKYCPVPREYVKDVSNSFKELCEEPKKPMTR